MGEMPVMRAVSANVVAISPIADRKSQSVYGETLRVYVSGERVGVNILGSVAKAVHRLHGLYTPLVRAARVSPPQPLPKKLKKTRYARSADRATRGSNFHCFSIYSW